MKTDVTIATFAAALGLPLDTDPLDVLAEVKSLRQVEGDEDGADLAMIKAGEHPDVRADGAELVVTLRYPLVSGSETIKELRVKRPTVGDLRKAEMMGQKAAGKGAPGDILRALANFAALTGRSIQELDGLDPDDLGALAACVAFFSARRRQTGR